MLPELRLYQAAGVDALRGHILAERIRVILCCPTGGGKTVLASYIIQLARTNFDARVLFVAHRIELIDQCVRQLAKWGVTEVGVIRADDKRTNELMPVQVATIQSLGRRSKPPADIIFVDECHRAVANSYRKLLELYPNAKIIGLTATPCRLDGKALGDVFQAIEVAATYEDLIKDCFIVEPRCFGTPVQPKLDGIKVQHGDFVIDELADAMMEIDVLGDTVAEHKKHAQGRRTVVFAVNVAHSKALLEKFLAAGVRAAHVDADTPEDERLAISAKLDSGELEVVTNCQIFTEGWDQPSVKCLIIARPTKSLVVFMQQAGRGLRPWNENTPRTRSWQPEDGPSIVPIIIDQGGNLDRHGFPHEDRRWSLEGKAESKERKPTKCIKCLAYIKHYPCPVCGFAPTPPPPRDIKQNADAQLEERVFVDPRKAFFDRKVEEARMKGFKPTYPSMKYKEEFEEWPPWSWSNGAKVTCALDEQWQRRITNKEADRARWKKQDEELKTPQYDTDDDFASWARRES